MTAKAVGSTGANGPASKPRSRISAVAMLLLFVSCAPAPVLRVSGGQVYEERAIAPAAYAAYARARLLESRGDAKGAAAQYRLVLANDPDSAEAMVRLAAVDCRNFPEQSAALFTKAERLDAHSSKLWLERARCEMAQGQLRAAAEHAKRALITDPTSVPAVSVAIAASTALGDVDSALTWLRAALAANPHDIQLWSVLFACKHVSRAEQVYAAAQVARLTPHDVSDIPPRYRSLALRRGTERDAATTILDDALHQALAQNDVNSARMLATRVGINPEELAILALSRGAFNVALAQSELLLALNPENSSAWVIGLVAADQLMQSERVLTLLAHPASGPLAPDSPLVGALLAMLQRRLAIESPVGVASTSVRVTSGSE